MRYSIALMARKQKVQLRWGTWSQVCEFVPFPFFVRGCTLNKDGKPMPEGQVDIQDHSIALIIRQRNGQEVIAKAYDWIVKDEQLGFRVERRVN